MQDELYVYLGGGGTFLPVKSQFILSAWKKRTRAEMRRGECARKIMPGLDSFRRMRDSKYESVFERNIVD